MLFQKEHIDMIKNAHEKFNFPNLPTKTVTRRDWKKKMAKTGGIYPVQEKMFQPKEECEIFIKTGTVHKEKLGAMTGQDADDEGGYTIEEFRNLWEEINNEEWNPVKIVWVIPFHPVLPEAVL